MPLERRAFIQLSILLLAVPVQYLFTQYWSAPKEERYEAVTVLVSRVNRFYENYLSWRTWKRWCRDIIQVSREASDRPEDEGYSSDGAETVDPRHQIKHRDPYGYFAGSSVPRSPRPSQTKFRIGQVVRHKLWGYRGIIVGWDENALAPELWLSKNHPPDKRHWREQTNYAILVDTRDREAQQTYVVEENIEVINQVEIIHPYRDDYFEQFDGTQYIAQPWLKELYPHDQ